MDKKLDTFEGFDDIEDEFTFNEEMEQITRAIEKLPHATQRAIIEMLDEQIYFRYPNRITG